MALAAGLVLGAVIERTVIRPVENKPPLNAVIVTIGLLVFLEGAGGHHLRRPVPVVPARVLDHRPADRHRPRSGSRRTTCSSPPRCWPPRSLLAALFRYTSVGLRLRAAAFSASVARLLGVRVGRMLTLGWALAGLIGALAGVLVTPHTFLYPNSMDSIFVLGFTAAVIGGLDSPVGAVVGGLHPRRGAQLRRRLPGLEPGATCSAWPSLILVLMVRPSGLFSPSATRQV